MYCAVGRSHVGKVRSQNQDAIFVSNEPVGFLPNLYIVADGMGGHNAGDVASQQAVAYFCSHIRQDNTPPESGSFLDKMVGAAMEANRAIYVHALENPALSGMGTTFTACVVHSGKCEIVHVGDSRAYVIGRKAITQITTDHSYVNEMVKAGQLTQSEAREHPKRNVLMRVMGVELDMAVDGCVRALEPEDALLLCSDGLTNMLTDEIIFSVVSEAVPLAERADSLIDRACLCGGIDNISVILIPGSGSSPSGV